jgi:clan AA aspartic protease (TIGR02281 family)
LPSASQIRGRLAHGGVLLVPVRVHGHDFEFLVDTGSAYTALSEDLVALLGLTIDPQRTAAIAPVQGAIMRVPLIILAELRVGGFRTANVEAMMVQFPRELRLDGVLGMNILKRFRMTIEMDTKTLVLRPIRGQRSIEKGPPPRG